jgi:multidrug transporter EmrE-like cation transporter
MKLFYAMSPVVLLIVYSQLITKWRATELTIKFGDANSLFDKALLYAKDPYIITSYIAALLASILWIFVVEKYDLSVAFPVYVGLTVLFVILGGCLFFSEIFNFTKLISMMLIVMGVALASRS